MRTAGLRCTGSSACLATNGIQLLLITSLQEIPAAITASRYHYRLEKGRLTVAGKKEASFFAFFLRGLPSELVYPGHKRRQIVIWRSRRH